jgi:hypothetical protein
LFTNVVVLVSACASSNLTQSGALSSYEKLQRSDGMLTQASFHVDKDRLMLAKTVSLIPASIADGARKSGLTPAQLALVANTINRSLCAGLSERLRIVEPSQPADLVVQAFVTEITTTDVTMAGVSSAANVGGSVAAVATGLPILIPRIPIGMGGLSVEAQATDAGRQQVAAMTWARGADALTTRPRASEEADAYVLANAFGDDFSRLIVTGADPIKGSIATPPSSQSVREFFGSKPKDAACEQFGRNPGVSGFVGGVIGLPPNWTDPGTQRP